MNLKIVIGFFVLLNLLYFSFEWNPINSKEIFLQDEPTIYQRYKSWSGVEK